MPNNTEYILKLENKLKQQENLIANFEKEQSASIQVFNQQKKTIESLQSSNTNLIVGNERLTQSNSQLKEQAKVNNKQLKDLDQEKKVWETQLTQEQNTILKIIQEKNNLAKELFSAKQTIKNLTNQNTSLIEKYTQLENHSQNLNKSLNQVQKELLSWQEKNQILEDKLEEWEKQAKETNSPSTATNLTLANEYQQKIFELEDEKETILTKAEKARNEQANQIEALEQENNQLDTDLNKAVDLLEQKDEILSQKDKIIEELNKTILELKNQTKNKAEIKQTTKTFLCSDCQQEKPHQELSRQFSNFSFCLECSKKARQIASQQKQKPQPQEFICHLCEKPKTEIPAKMKLDQTLQEYSVCSSCRPTAKEFNEADLITDDLWNKYPYSSASEILELEFGIRK